MRFWVFLLPLLVFSCKKEDGVPTKFHYEYFPDKVGKWVQYDVEEINVDELNLYYDTLRYQLKETIESTFIDNQGRPSLRIQREWRIADTLPWVIKDIWFATRSTTQAEKIEEDVRYLKMVFAVNSDKQWNGNVYNTLGEETYEYDLIHEPLIIGSLSFDSTVTVIQRDASNFFEISDATEVFAKNVGLVKKDDVYYYITYVSGNPKYTGTAFHQTATAYGE